MKKSSTSKKAMPAMKVAAPKGKGTSMMMSNSKKGMGGKMNGKCPY